MNIAVYPGSFNPMHKGHLAVTKYLLDSGGFDMVYMVVTPRNPFKSDALRSSADERLSAAREAVRRNALQDRVLVDDIEFDMPLPSYTIDTLDALRAREPENHFSLVVGADNLSELPDWKDGVRIMSDYGVAVYPRDGYDMEGDADALRRRFPAQILKIELMPEAPLVNISSTRLRSMIADGKDVSLLLA